MPDDNGWTEYRREVFYRLDKLDERLGRMEVKQDAHARSLAALKVKGGLWGGLSGALIVAAEYLRRTLTGGA
jgi:hypothetical protein